MVSIRHTRFRSHFLAAMAIALLPGCSAETPEYAEVSPGDVYVQEIKNEAVRALARIEQQPAAARMAADEYATITGEMFEDDDPPETEHAATIQQLNDGIRELGSMSDATAIRTTAQELREVANSLPGELYLDPEEGGPRESGGYVDLDDR